MFTFASILMLAGVAGRKSFLLVPWYVLQQLIIKIIFKICMYKLLFFNRLIICFMTLLFFLIMAISAMFAIANIKALAVIFPAGMNLYYNELNVEK